MKRYLADTWCGLLEGVGLLARVYKLEFDIEMYILLEEYMEVEECWMNHGRQIGRSWLKGKDFVFKEADL